MVGNIQYIKLRIPWLACQLVDRTWSWPRSFNCGGDLLVFPVFLFFFLQRVHVCFQHCCVWCLKPLMILCWKLHRKHKISQTNQRKMSEQHPCNEGNFNIAVTVLTCSWKVSPSLLIFLVPRALRSPNTNCCFQRNLDVHVLLSWHHPEIWPQLYSTMRKFKVML